MASARDRYGAHRRARHLCAALGSRVQGVLGHRRAHRGRCARDRRRSGRAHGVSGEDARGGRAHGARIVTAQFDIAIIGGGMAGASLAVALEGLGVRTALIEAVPYGATAQPSFDERTTALSNGSRRILETLGVWPQVASEAAPIARIHVSDRGHFGFARIDAREQGLAALGYVVPNRALGAALWSRLGRSADL